MIENVNDLLAKLAIASLDFHDPKVAETIDTRTAQRTFGLLIQ